MTTLNDLKDEFALFDDWEDRYRYLIDLGHRVPKMDPAFKIDENLVRGCTSRVWMVQEWRGEKLHFQANSDAQIVQGLIYILLLAFQDKTVDEIKSVPIDRIFEDFGLNQHLSPNRRNGFFAMVEKIKNS
jgi:cysteine desulfuration protein SufE